MIPTIEIIKVSKSKISNSLDFNICMVEFRCTNTDVGRFEIRAVKSGGTVGRGRGLLVEKDDALYPSENLLPSELLYPSDYSLGRNVSEFGYIFDNELTMGDGEYTVSIYCQSTDGDWNA